MQRGRPLPALAAAGPARPAARCRRARPSPPNDTLVFEIEVLQIAPGMAAMQQMMQRRCGGSAAEGAAAAQGGGRRRPPASGAAAGRSSAGAHRAAGGALGSAPAAALRRRLRLRAWPAAPASASAWSSIDFCSSAVLIIATIGSASARPMMPNRAPNEELRAEHQRRREVDRLAWRRRGRSDSRRRSGR